MVEWYLLDHHEIRYIDRDTGEFGPKEHTVMELPDEIAVVINPELFLSYGSQREIVLTKRQEELLNGLEFRGIAVGAVLYIPEIVDTPDSPIPVEVALHHHNGFLLRSKGVTFYQSPFNESKVPEIRDYLSRFGVTDFPTSSLKKVQLHDYCGMSDLYHFDPELKERFLPNRKQFSKNIFVKSLEFFVISVVYVGVVAEGLHWYWGYGELKELERAVSMQSHEKNQAIQYKLYKDFHQQNQAPDFKPIFDMAKQWQGKIVVTAVAWVGDRLEVKIVFDPLYKPEMEHFADWLAQNQPGGRITLSDTDNGVVHLEYLQEV